MHIKLQALRAKVRGFHVAGCSLRRRIQKSSGDRKNKLWDEKRKLGTFARDHVIAYCLLRGMPYDRVEKKCSESNKPDPTRIFEIMQAHAAGRAARELTLDRVANMLEWQLVPREQPLEGGSGP